MSTVRTEMLKRLKWLLMKEMGCRANWPFSSPSHKRILSGAEKAALLQAAKKAMKMSKRSIGKVFCGGLLGGFFLFLWHGEEAAALINLVVEQLLVGFKGVALQFFAF